MNGDGIAYHEGFSLSLKIERKVGALNFVDRCIVFVVALRIIGGMIHAFAPMTPPHMWRQGTTLGVAARYWLRLTVEKSPPPFWLPAVLESGDTQGVMPMEFPLLGWLGSIGFSAGPYWGVVCAHLIHLIFVFALIMVNFRIWKGIYWGPVAARRVIVFAPFFSFAGFFAIKFMPDVSAFLIVLWGLGLLAHDVGPTCRAIIRYKIDFAAFFLISVGLLVKPTAAPVLVVILLDRKNIVRSVKRAAIPVILALSVSAIYYTKGMILIDHFREREALFATNIRPPIESLINFFSDLPRLFNMLNDNVLFPYGGIVAAVILVMARRSSFRRNIAFLVGLIFLQLIAIAGLDGVHAFQHIYYFASLAPIAAAIWISVGDNLPNNFMKVFWAGLLLVRSIEIFGFDIQGHWRSDSPAMMFQECRAIVREHPDIPFGHGEVFQSYAEDYPLLGLCFLEREESKVAHYGIFFTKGRAIPEGCHEMIKGKYVIVAECSKNHVE